MSDRATVLASVVSQWMTGLIEKVAAINHTRGWGRFTLGTTDAEPEHCFAFITWDTKTALRAKEVLEQAGLLCDTDLGPSPEIRARYQ